ncbi:isoprenylcysteine carboxylmethyltransferase family protein [Mycoplasmatota bacterium WC44]
MNRIKSMIEVIGIFESIASIIITLCVVLIYLRVYANFKQAEKLRVKRKEEKKSIVETFSMSMFFIVCYLVVVLRIGQFNMDILFIRIIALIVFGVSTYINIAGRNYLGNNWGNNVIIYENHTLVKEGVYKIIRHPLYASIIWMIYAVSIIYMNFVVGIFNTIIFIPFMYYRAKQEEKLLSEHFSNYQEYKKEVGMFFPKVWR